MSVRNAIVVGIVLSTGTAGWLLSQPMTSHRSAAPAVSPSVIVSANSYFCPMHPYVTSTHPGNCPICGMRLVAHNHDLAGHTRPLSDDKNAPVIEVAPEITERLGLTYETVALEDYKPTLHLTGQIISDERGTVNLAPKAEGWIRHLYVAVPGQRLSRGQTLFELYSPELQQRQRDYLDLLARRDSLVQNAGGMNSTLGRSAPDGMLASTARERFRLRNQLLALDFPESVLQELEATRRIRDIVPIVAAHDGRVTAIGATEGAFVTPAQTVVTYTDPHAVWADLLVQPEQQHLLHGGELEILSPMNPTVRVRARLDGAFTAFDPGSRTLRLRVPLHAASSDLQPGAAVDALLYLPGHKALTVDCNAVIYTGEGDFVIVQRAPDQFQQVAVRAGGRSGERIEVVGLTAGQRIVANGQFLLSAESTLRSLRQRASAIHD